MKNNSLRFFIISLLLMIMMIMSLAIKMISMLPNSEKEKIEAYNKGCHNGVHTVCISRFRCNLNDIKPFIEECKKL